MESPRSAAGGVAGDEAIWRKLREAGFDEDAVRRRDKATLISYISRLESEIYEYQHNLGLILLERKELTSKYEQLKASSEATEIMLKRERAAQQSALAETRKREENLKKNFSIQKECVANLEKALHDMRGETAEIKVSYEAKLAEALQMIEAAQKKNDEAEEKLLAAKSLEAVSIRTRNSAMRSLQDIEDREDQLRRYRASCELENESKQKEMSLQRKSLDDTKKILHEKEQTLLKEQALLNQRDENILERLAYITHSEKRLEEEKLNLQYERKVLVEDKNKLELKMQAITSREEAIIQKESLLDKRESELLIFQETIASKERAEIERLRQEQEITLARRKYEFDTEMDNKLKSFEAEIEARIALLDQRETALNDQERAVAQREQNVNLRLSKLTNEEESLVKRSDELKEEEGKLSSHEEALHVELQKEREEIQNMKLDLEKEKAFFEEEKREAIQAQENLAITQNEREYLLNLQMKLKEEIDNLRAQKMELMIDAERLQAEKERFEIEWELIDEKEEELQKESVKIAEERRVITEHLKNELDIIKQEKENLRVQFKNNSESLAREHEEFMNKMQQEHASWLSRIQQEREDLKRDVDIQRMGLLSSAKARQMEIDSYLREKEQEFEQKKSKELEYMNSEKETINSSLEHVRLELQKLEDERNEAMLERERREQELSEIKNTIDALNKQREKLQEQRKLLHSDREAITQQIQQLNELEELKIESENKQLSLRPCGKSKHDSVENVKENDVLLSHDEQNASPKKCSSPKLLLGKKLEVSPSVSTPISWVRKCAQVIFKRSPEKNADHDDDRFVQNGVPAKLGNVNDFSLATAYSGGKSKGLFADQLENGAGHGAKVGEKRLNNTLSQDQSEILEPKRKHRRSTTQTQRVIGGEIDSNCPSVLEEKCSKNEHDAVPVGLSGSNKDHELENEGLHNLRAGDLDSSDDVLFANGKADTSDFPEDGKPSGEILVSASEPLNGDGLEDKDEHADDSDDDEGEEEEKTSSAKKLWRFLIT
ncbi:nuclear matrix constituent protein 1b-like isoform X2 [Phragmites australis]|uniref:nuclear matrix constituent protein 1b-like isoform X2 n=1 Tax=Phragmites australis TaxID=29695 RepID=UPI002D7700A2|nr:nuclear matrix constituent protein 1b-like isoform X2 [Phragmites australis]